MTNVPIWGFPPLAPAQQKHSQIPQSWEGIPGNAERSIPLFREEAELPPNPPYPSKSPLSRANSCSSSIRTSGQEGNEDLMELCLQQSRDSKGRCRPRSSSHLLCSIPRSPFSIFSGDGFLGELGRFQLNPNTACASRNPAGREGQQEDKLEISPPGWSCFSLNPGKEVLGGRGCTVEREFWNFGSELFPLPGICCPETSKSSSSSQ